LCLDPISKPSISYVPRTVCGRPFVKRFALCCRTVVCAVCPVCLSVCDVGVLWPNGGVDQDETWHRGRPQPRLHCLRWELSSSPKRAQRRPPPQFSAHICCDQTTGWIKMPLGTEVGLGQRHIVLDGEPASSPIRGSHPQFPNFRPIYLLWPNSWMDEDATWYGDRPRRR